MLLCLVFPAVYPCHILSLCTTPSLFFLHKFGKSNNITAKVQWEKPTRAEKKSKRVCYCVSIDSVVDYGFCLFDLLLKAVNLY